MPSEPDPALDTAPLLDETMYLAAPGRPAWPPSRAAATTPWIVAGPGTLCHTVTVRACQADGFMPRTRHHADDFVTVLALVAAGQGVAVVPRARARPPRCRTGCG